MTKMKQYLNSGVYSGSSGNKTPCLRYGQREARCTV